MKLRSDTRGNALLSTAVLLLFVSLLLLHPPMVWAGPDFDLTPPPGWLDNTTNLKPDMLRQIAGPNFAGLVEVYSYNIPRMELEQQADFQENAIRALGLTYALKRLSSQQVSLNGVPAVRRTYSGHYNGLPQQSVLLFLYYDKQAMLVQGISVVGSGLEKLTEECLNSFKPRPQSQTAALAAVAAPVAAAVDEPPRITPPPPVKSSLADPASLLLSDTRLDDALGGKKWETDALLDRAEERSLAGGAKYRLAYASYTPVGADSPEVDMQVYTGGDAALSQLAENAQKTLGKKAGPGHFGQWCVKGSTGGRAVIWFKKSGALIKVTAPDEKLAARLANLILE